MSTQFLKITLAICLCFICVEGVGKFNSLNCGLLRPDWLEVKECRIKAFNRTSNVINIRAIIKRTVKEGQIAFKLLKRERGGWHPFFYDMKIDVCDFFKKPYKYPIPKLMYSYMEKYVNINRSCPFATGTEVNFLGWQIEEASVISRFPIDFGQYGLHTSWFSNKTLLFQINGSIIYSQY